MTFDVTKADAICIIFVTSVAVQCVSKPIALRTAKTPKGFGCSECNMVKDANM